MVAQRIEAAVVDGELRLTSARKHPLCSGPGDDTPAFVGRVALRFP